MSIFFFFWREVKNEYIKTRTSASQSTNYHEV
jgi:hypothetical protein